MDRLVQVLVLQNTANECVLYNSHHRGALDASGGGAGSSAAPGPRPYGSSAPRAVRTPRRSRTPPHPSLSPATAAAATAAHLPRTATDLREMMFGTAPILEAAVTKLHVSPAQPALVLATKVFQARAKPRTVYPGVGTVGTGSMSAIPLITAQTPTSSLTSHAAGGAGVVVGGQKSSLALAVCLLADGASVAVQMRQFAAAHYALIDARMARAVAELKERVNAVLGDAALASLAATPSSSFVCNPASMTPRGSLTTPLLGAAVNANTPVVAPQVLLRAYSLQDDKAASALLGNLRSSVVSLLCGARLSPPLWLGVAATADGRPPPEPGKAIVEDSPLAAQLAESVCSLAKYDTQGSGYFVSSAITAALAWHRAWITSVDVVEDGAVMDADAAGYSDSKFLCNHIAAQLRELHGSSGGEAVTRVIVSGSDEEACENLLSILSYFVRCPSVMINAPKTEVDSPNPLFAQPSDPVRSGLPTPSPTPSPSPSPSPSPNPYLKSLSSGAGSDRSDLSEEPSVAALEIVEMSPEDYEENVQTVGSPGPALSLYGGIHERFDSDLVLLGVRSKRTDLLYTLGEELQGQAERSQLHAVAVIADMDAKRCEVLVARPGAGAPERHGCVASFHIASALESVRALRAMDKVPSEACLLLIEDRLRELVLMARAMLRYMRSLKSPPSKGRLERDLQISENDLPLVAAVSRSLQHIGMSIMR
eukprot:m51a1_g2450 hypothetical protein (709) ;mRNA; f:888756-891009